MNNNRSLFNLILDLIFYFIKRQTKTGQPIRKNSPKKNYSNPHSSSSGIKEFDSIKPFEKIQVTLDHHVDGDTEEFIYKGRRFRARFLMVDTPETKKEGQAVMKIGPEASKFTEETERRARKIEISFDKGPKTDNYGRYLVYVYCDGKNLQEEILRRGYGIVRYVNPPNNSLEADFKKAENEAKRKKLGVWAIKGYVITKSNPQHAQFPNYMYDNNMTI